MDVTCAIIVKGKMVLMARRAIGQDRSGQWEFPGGKVLMGEKNVDCIRREIREELNIEIKVLFEYKSVEYDYPDKSILLTPFVCAISNGKPQPLVHSELKWMSRDELLDLDLCSADRLLINLNLDILTDFLQQQ